jgi:hypothetical protein
MNILSKVTAGKKVRPQVTLIYGPNKVGKSLFASRFPDPIILDLEGGSSHLDVQRIGPDEMSTFETFNQVLTELLSSDHKYRTVVIDTAESLEGLIFDHILSEGKVKSIEQYGGGFGKGYVRSRELMREVMHKLKTLNEKKQMHVNIVAHSQVKTHTDPHENVQYDRFIMRTNDKMAAIIKDLVDQILFATYKVYTKHEEGKNKAKAYGEGERVMFTEWRPAFDAGNRLGLPFEMPLSYETYMSAVQASSRPENMHSSIASMLLQLKGDIKSKAESHYKAALNDPEKLIAVHKRLVELTKPNHQ